MPVMDGIACTKELRRLGSLTPIIGLTANADHETRTEAINAGMTDLLTKPLSLQSLRRVSRQYRDLGQPQ